MFSILMRLIGRLSVGRKLILIYALDLSAVIFVSGILINEKFIAIDFARKEIVGNSYIAVVRDALLALPPPHALPAATIDPRSVERLSEAESKLGEGMDSRHSAQDLFERLTEHGVPPEQRVQKSILAGKALITRIGNQSNLILDPDLDSYYTMSLLVLRFPELLEVTDLICKKVAQRLNVAPSELNRVQTDYLILEGRLDAIAKGIDSDYVEAIAAIKPEFKAPLSHSREALSKVINAFSGRAHSVVIEGEMLGEVGESASLGGQQKPDKFSLKAASIDLTAELTAAWTGAGATLDQLLNARVDALFHRMWLHLGTAATLLMLILSIVYFVARQIALPVSQLANVADQVRSTGNYDLRAVWDSHDEIGRLVNGFNGMLAQLNHSRLIEQEMAASKRAAAAQAELLEAIPIPLVVTAIPQHEVLHTNMAAQSWLEGRTTDPWMAGLTPAARVKFFQQLSDQGAVNEFEVLWHGSKSQTWALISASRLSYQGTDSILTTFTPINGLKLMEKHLELWGKVFAASSESIIITDARNRIVNINRAFTRVSGYEFDDVAGKTPLMLQSDRHPDGFFEEIWRIASFRGSWQGELWVQRKTGEVFPQWAVVNSVRDDNNQITHFIVMALDITEQKANEQRISHLAHHDVLTDLPNRSLCIERLRMALQQAERKKNRVGVLFIDLDRFKNINDSLGHHVGDALLRSVSRALFDAVRPSDTVSRLGGDEFVVILNGVVDKEEVIQIVDHRLIPLIRKPHDVEGVELHVSCSVGIALYPEDGTEIDILMRNADAAMYQAKSSGRNNAQFFTAELDSRARERMKIETDLRNVVERGELRLFYQPRVDCRTGKLLGAEALVRWEHPEDGMVMPGRFIPIAEEAGLIVPIGAWVLGEACRQQALWRDQGMGDIAISVNLSTAQLNDPELIEVIKSTLVKWNTTPQKIELELTESLLMENVGSTIDLLHAIKALGVSLSIDDFGTGYSSLNYLHRFPIDKLKIDQSFVRDMLDDPNDLAITRAIIGLGHTLNLKVVAEGVENREEARMLAAAGCDELQGYLFSRPLPVDEFMRWKKENG